MLKFSTFSPQSEIFSREILSFGDAKNLTKNCVKEIQNLLEKSRKVPRLKMCQSLQQPAGDFEHALKHLSTKLRSSCFYKDRREKIFLKDHWTYLRSRKSDPALKWLFDRLQAIGSKFERFDEVGNIKNGIIYLGLLDPAIQNGIREGIGNGGPLGELVQWADVIAALDSSDLMGFRIVISLDELGLIKGKTCYEETEFPNIDFLITDITGAKEGFYRNRIRWK